MHHTMTNVNTENRRPWSFVEVYPSIARWVQEYGWIELGEGLPGRSFIQALDEGGLIWEGDAAYPTIDAALQALDTALSRWMREQFGE
jgi:hypothetical protein